MCRGTEIYDGGWRELWGGELWDVVGLLSFPLCPGERAHLDERNGSGRAYSPRFLFSWPNARIGVMGSEQLSAVMETVGKTVDPELKARIERESHAVFASARLWDDGVIPPSHTRDVLGQALRAAKVGWEKETKFGVFRM